MAVINIKSWFFRVVFIAFTLSFSCLSWAESGEGQEDGSSAVMDIFVEQAIADAEMLELTEERKHQVLFVMGVLLIVLLAATAYFGISMGLGGKNVFVQHMVCAGLALTLSLAHAVTAVVWFFPF